MCCRCDDPNCLGKQVLCPRTMSKAMEDGRRDRGMMPFRCHSDARRRPRQGMMMKSGGQCEKEGGGRRENARHLTCMPSTMVVRLSFAMTSFVLAVHRLSFVPPRDVRYHPTHTSSSRELPLGWASVSLFDMHPSALERSRLPRALSGYATPQYVSHPPSPRSSACRSVPRRHRVTLRVFFPQAAMLVGKWSLVYSICIVLLM